MSKRQGVETVKCGDKVFTFRGTFENLARIEEEAGINMITVFSSLSSNAPVATLVKTVLTHCIDSENKSDDIEFLLIEYGFQECWALCYTLLSHMMIGDKKKRSLTRQNVMKQAFDSILMNIGLAPWQWALMILSFGGSLCGAISLYLSLSS